MIQSHGAEQCRKEIMEFFGLDIMTVVRVDRIEKTDVGKYNTFVSKLSK